MRWGLGTGLRMVNVEIVEMTRGNVKYSPAPLVGAFLGFLFWQFLKLFSLTVLRPMFFGFFGLCFV